jgi:non-ribosomal peptide synthase protein (TIGR01720 family)
MAVDAVSWRILLPDLHSLYRQLLAERRPQLPPKSTAFQTWAVHLENQAHAAEIEHQVDYWRDVLRHPPLLPLNDADAPPHEAEMASLTVTLDEETTTRLVRDVPAAYHSGIDDALLSGLARALAPWSGSRTLLVDLENHGRHAPESMDLSRTVGWFTTLYPVRLEIPAGAGPAAALQAVKEQLRQVPDHGLGYGLLRYRRNEPPLADLPTPVISFNYLGKLKSERIDGWHPASEATGPERAGDAVCSHPLQINGALLDDRLRFTWSYASAAVDAATIRRLAEAHLESLRALGEQAQDPDAGGYTPSDFPELDLSQEDLDALLVELADASEG